MLCSDACASPSRTFFSPKVLQGIMTGISERSYTQRFPIGQETLRDYRISTLIIKPLFSDKEGGIHKSIILFTNDEVISEDIEVPEK